MRLFLISLLAVMLFTFAGYFWFDLSLHTSLQPHVLFLQPTLVYVTMLGEGLPWIVGSLLVFIIFRFIIVNKDIAQKALFLFYSLMGSGLIGLILKSVFGRIRPYIYDSHHEYGLLFFTIAPDKLSFPSGHSITFFVLATTFALFRPKWSLMFYTLATVGASTRVLLDKHYLSDIVAGAFIGVFFTLFLHSIFTKKGLFTHDT